MRVGEWHFLEQMKSEMVEILAQKYSRYAELVTVLGKVTKTWLYRLRTSYSMQWSLEEFRSTQEIGF